MANIAAEGTHTMDHKLSVRDVADFESALKRVAAAAAAEVIATATAAASGVAATAASAAQVLVEATRVDLQYIKDDLKEIKNELKEFKGKLKVEFVSIEAFEPIRRLVYGLVGLILVAVVVGMLTLVIRK